MRTFDAHAEACAAWLRKGRKVGVSGKLALEEWSGTDGRPRQRYSVIGKVEFLDKPWREGEVEEVRGGPVDTGPAEQIGLLATAA